MSRLLSLFKNFLRASILSLKWTIAAKRTGLTRVTAAKDIELSFLGSQYGGWYLSLASLPKRPVMLSAGVGEDITFDLAFAKAARGSVTLVDPTPRSIHHVNNLFAAFENTGGPLTFETGGVMADISTLTKHQFQYVPLALFDSSKSVRFYPPRDQNHVSYSIANIQRTDGHSEVLEVRALTVSDLMREVGLEVIHVAKFDIEGVAADVVAEMLEGGIFPLQIAVELEELLHPSKKNEISLNRLAEALVNNGYCLAFRHQVLNFLFIRTGDGI